MCGVPQGMHAPLGMHTPWACMPPGMLAPPPPHMLPWVCMPPLPPPPRRILRDAVNERAVRILLECILV